MSGWGSSGHQLVGPHDERTALTDRSHQTDPSDATDQIDRTDQAHEGQTTAHPCAATRGEPT